MSISLCGKAFMVLVLVTLTGCSARPYPVKPPQEAVDFAVNSPRATGQRSRAYFWQPVQRVQALSYCYSSLYNSPEDVRAEAQDFCRGGTVEYYSADTEPLGCALLQIHRLTFICFPGDEIYEGL